MARALPVITGLATSLLIAGGLVLAASAEEAAKSPQVAEGRSSALEAFFKRRAYRSRPRRPRRPFESGRVREENISDNEVREIGAVMHRYYPGAILNISAVTTGCACADGPACDNQVWVVADRGSISNGLLLSRIGGLWMIGPVQEWWLAYEDHQRRFRDVSKVRDREERGRLYEELSREGLMLEEWAPQCDEALSVRN